MIQIDFDTIVNSEMKVTYKYKNTDKIGVMIRDYTESDIDNIKTDNYILKLFCKTEDVSDIKHTDVIEIENVEYRVAKIRQNYNLRILLLQRK